MPAPKKRKAEDLSSSFNQETTDDKSGKIKTFLIIFSCYINASRFMSKRMSSIISEPSLLVVDGNLQEPPRKKVKEDEETPSKPVSFILGGVPGPSSLT